MNFFKKRELIFTVIIIILILTGIFYTYKKFHSKSFVSKSTQQCIKCHKEKNIHTVQILEWEKSQHGQKSVGCYECHQAKKGDPDLWDHEGFLMSKIVSPLDCARCHKKEFDEFNTSHHAKAGEILGSADNFLGEVVQGDSSSTQGCQSCHGSVVKIIKDNKLDPKTWPNLGIGRLNPDGSKGSCSTCHSKHNFALDVARSPESCGKCHLGPDHPHKEIYEESIHGRIYLVKEKDMNLDSHQWILGEDYTAAPNCVTCHMGANKDLLSTHNIGERLSWNLRLALSKPMENSQQKRDNMKLVCTKCHGPEWVDNFYTQLDRSVNLYDQNYGKPAKEIMVNLMAKNKLTKTPFDEEIEWVYFELWHHEGRRVRHGAAMMGPDYVQWNGFYELARNFYFKFIPLARKLGEGEYIDNMLKKPEHQWIKGIKPENLKIQEAAFEEWNKMKKDIEDKK